MRAKNLITDDQLVCLQIKYFVQQNSEPKFGHNFIE